MSSRIFSPSVLVPYALLLGLVLGLGSAYWAVRGEYPVGGVQIGPWRTWPKIGTPDIDPYARAIIARRAEIPLAIGEGLALTATRDSEGRRLIAPCTYRIGSVMPATRFWTLAVYDRRNNPIRPELGRSGFTSSEILRNSAGGFDLVLSRNAQAGNWLQLTGEGPFSVILRLYDMPGAVGASTLEPHALPSIERLGCAS
ncbi:DUF1214 domain-containing protein [Microvirga flavescens]|uniref:DUF1214 domain-containing protein n=1 Tax=Microvirga flavescens TaxID=2249811 RepID=UPI0013007990|nr:DUF1214 domain-containing protein [Microvirga flavescens]